MKPTRFNIRVYALISNEQGEILLSHEQMGSHRFTKFPGGGLEFGEGILDCLHREIREECRQELVDVEHFYTTDFYQVSAFRHSDQLLSIYYTARFKHRNVNAENLLPSIQEELDKNQTFMWHDLRSLQKSDLNFPVDKLVLELLQKATGRNK